MQKLKFRTIINFSIELKTLKVCLNTFIKKRLYMNTFMKQAIKPFNTRYRGKVWQRMGNERNFQ